jgi:hypothetical protein
METYYTDRRTLQRLGVNMLTSEADPFSFRVLCDLTQPGVDLIAGVLGHTVSFSARPWNDGVASVMLPHAWLPWLIIYHIVSSGQIAIHVPATSTPYQDAEYILACDTPAEADERTTRYEAAGRPYHAYRNWSDLCGQPNQNGRNVHAWSGRTV